MANQKILVGIPSFAGPPAETAWDYMRMWYHFGRRMLDYDFFFTPIGKSEQYRARNRIVRMARMMDADYLLMLDDDHVIDWMDSADCEAYDFLRKLLAHDKAVIGALYYHRGDQMRNVLMVEDEEPWKYRFILDNEITGGLQEVAVQGGGCLLVKKEVFDRMDEPYFVPEAEVGKGTDVQFCEKARRMGYSVWCDTGIVLGHVMNERTIITPKNRETLYLLARKADRDLEDKLWNKRLAGLIEDAEEYTGMDRYALYDNALMYRERHLSKFPAKLEERDEYYRNIGVDQLCRQFMYHSEAHVMANDTTVINNINTNKRYRILDFGCGAGVIGFELLRIGHLVDFIDIDGAYSYEFLKWRIRKHNMLSRASFSIDGPYDVVLLMDIIEHLEEWREPLDDILRRVNNQGVVISNFLQNEDRENAEHVFMDKGAFSKFLTDRGFVPFSGSVWVKHQMGG